MEPTKVIKRPIVTEKSTKLTSKGEYTFAVDLQAKKPEIAKAVELIFGVKVAQVRTAVMPGKSKRVGKKRYQTKLGSWKKALVRLVKGEKIELLEVS